MYVLLFSTLITLTSFLHAAELCQRHSSCDELNDLSFACSEKWDQSTCDKFTDTFEKLLVPQACQESGKQILWALSSCDWKEGNTPTDLHYDRLARLPFAKALKLYTSEKLRKTMDGAIAESHLKKSKADEKLLGKTLLPSKFLKACNEFEYIDFNTVKKDLNLNGKSLPQYSYQEGKAGDYIFWMGDIPNKIINTKTKKECVVKASGFVEKITKVPGLDIARYEIHRENGTNWDALIDMKTCQRIWEATWEAAETVSGESARKITVDNVQKSAWKKCAPCWNKQKTGCLRVL